MRIVQGLGALELALHRLQVSLDSFDSGQCLIDVLPARPLHEQLVARLGGGFGGGGAFDLEPVFAVIETRDRLAFVEQNG